MKTSSYISERERATIFTTKISDKEIMLALETDLINQIRSEIASRIADQIMAKLAPAIDKALVNVQNP